MEDQIMPIMLTNVFTVPIRFLSTHNTKVRKHFIRFSYDVCLRPTRRSATTSWCLKRRQFEHCATHVVMGRQATDDRDPDFAPVRRTSNAIEANIAERS